MKHPFHNFVSAGEEEQHRPGENPREGQVEKPSNPHRHAPLINRTRAVDHYPLMLLRKLYRHMTAIIGLRDRGTEQLLLFLGVVIYNLAFENEGFDFCRICNVSLAPSR